MRKFLLGLTTAAALCAPGQLLAAQSKGDVGHDIRCFLAVSTLLNEQDKETHEAGVAASNFFAGKIFGTAPDIDLPAAFQREAGTLTEAAIKALMTDCGHEMEARGEALSRAAEALGDGESSGKK